MIINYENVELIKFPYVHDAVFEGLCYNYYPKKISFSLQNTYINTTVNCILNNVLFFEMQGCSFWGGGNALYYASCYKKHDFLQRIQERVCTETTAHPNWYSISKNTHYIVFELIINSGDTLLVVCESVEFELNKAGDGLPEGQGDGSVVPLVSLRKDSPF